MLKNEREFMYTIIPKINGSVKPLTGEYVLPPSASCGTDFPDIDEIFVGRLSAAGLIQCNDSKDSSTLVKYIASDMKNEAYRLEIAAQGITVYASDKSGYSNALVSLFQLLSYGKGKATCCTITDEPRFEHRGFMLDVCRHFFSVDEVKKILEQMALLKMNRFHWLLSNDQGYRIESKKFPKLNQISSYRKLSSQDPLVSTGEKQEGEIYGGYYSQEEIKDVIAFAAARNIEIVPEIEMPGHATAILAAYPEYTCEGKDIDVASTFGIHDTVFCPGNQEAYPFVAELIGEVCSLFPSRFIHLGGDETPTRKWKACKTCDAVMKEQGFTNYEQLQGYFTQKVLDMVKDKTPIVWNESLLARDFNKNAVIQYWFEMRQEKSYALPEIEKGRKFVLSSMNNFYSDYSYAEIPLKATLMYEPQLKGVNIPDENVLGIESPLWTEWLTKNEQLEKMMWPRLAAVAECGWTKEKDYGDFLVRIENLLKNKGLSILNAEAWEKATIHGQEALDMIVYKMLELSQNHSKSASTSVDDEPHQKSDPAAQAAMISWYIGDKMKDACSESDIDYVVNKLMKIMGSR